MPPGVHQATLEEVQERFGHGSEQREALSQSLDWLVPLCKQAGIAKILLNGSFVTDRIEPNDADCILLQGPEYRRYHIAVAELRKGLPFLDIKIVDEGEYNFYAESFFAMIAISYRKVLWR
ncbi:MAG: hypothetical protein FWD53_04755 [Phycisphaerales bacterium]|nr:hypothetical protein [Phycisphaerales bacterium]